MLELDLEGGVEQLVPGAGVRCLQPTVAGNINSTIVSNNTD